MLNKINLSLITLMVFAFELRAQEKFIVYTFEVNRKPSKHKETFYFISSVDSIAEKNTFQVFPLYLDGYSNDKFQRCKSGSIIDIFTATDNSDFNFSQDYTSEISKLQFLIKKNKVKLQTINKSSADEKSKTNINVYASSIIGKFCKCAISHVDSYGGFKGTVYLPDGLFINDSNFWEGKYAKVVKYVDYSFIEYSSHYPEYRHGNNNIRIKSGINTYQ